MKICVIFSSNLESPFRDVQNFRDPCFYYTKTNHEFYCVKIQKESFKKDLEEILKFDEFDLFWSFMSGKQQYDVDAVKYVETKNVPIIGASSKFLSMTELDIKRLISAAGIKIPKWKLSNLNNMNVGEGLEFPDIIKPIRGLGNHQPSSFICFNEEQLSAKLVLLETQSQVQSDILIEEYIEGIVVSMLVFETVEGVIGLRPVINAFPPNYLRLTEEVADKPIEDSDMLIKIQKIGVKAYEALGVHGSGYATVEFMVKHNDNNCIYLTNVTSKGPTVRFLSGDKSGIRIAHDIVIEKILLGGHDEFLEIIIQTKLRLDAIIKTYDEVSERYDQVFIKVGMENSLKEFINEFKFDGSVLDLGCGSGTVGRRILEKHPGAKLTGVDVSPLMVKIASEQYSQVHVGLVENIMVELCASDTHLEFDHVISFALFQLLDSNKFKNILRQAFSVAKSSVSFCIEDIPQEYNDKLIEANDVMLHFNHIKAFQNFKPPPNWTLVYKKRQFLWESPHYGIKINGLVVRFEN